MSEPIIAVEDTSIVRCDEPAVAVVRRVSGDGREWEGLRIPCAVVQGAPIFPITSDTIGKIAPAFSKAQSKFETAKRDRENPGFKSPTGYTPKYADLASVHDACINALNAQGLSVMHFTVPVGEQLYLLTRVMHDSGEWLQSAFPLSTIDSVRTSITEAARPATAPVSGGLDATGGEATAKKKRAPGVQALGSEITYLRRYCLAALVGVVSDDDDDGNAAQAHVQQARSAAPTRPPVKGGI